MLNLRLQNLKQPIVSSITLTLCILGISLLQLPHLSQKEHANSEFEHFNHQVEAERLRLNLLKQLPSFGLDNLVADWTFLSFAQYFGDVPARDRTGYSLSPEYFEIILDRDPRFLEAYFALSISSSLYAAMPERTVALIEQGLQSISPKVPHKAYYIWRYKGTDELLFLGDAKAAQRSFETSAEWADTYSDPEAERVAKLSRQFAQFLAKNPESKLAQINAWILVFNNVADKRTRQYVIRRIGELDAEVFINSEGRVQVALPKE